MQLRDAVSLARDWSRNDGFARTASTAESGVCSFFTTREFLCLKYFPKLDESGKAVRLCHSTCKTAFNKNFAACPLANCAGGDSVKCLESYEQNCADPENFTLTFSQQFFAGEGSTNLAAAPCDENLEVLFPEFDNGIGYYIGISLGVLTLLFVCCMCRATRNALVAEVC